MKKWLLILAAIFLLACIIFIIRNTAFYPPSQKSQSDLPFYQQLKPAVNKGESSPLVKGITTDQVLADTASPMYIQYLPLPGKANFSSNQFNGSASINYPIKLPPGPGGYGPGLSVNYSSSSVDELMHGIDTKKLTMFTTQSGPLGLGWSLYAGEGSISVDTHDKPGDPCFWTYKITFPGGSADLVKVDANGNKIIMCRWTHDIGNQDYYWAINQEWIDSKEWRTNPELFLKIQQGWASDFFPNDADFSFSRTKYGENIYTKPVCHTNSQGQEVCYDEPIDDTYAESERFDVWKVSAPDGSVYVFGNGKTPHHLQNNLATPENSGSYIFTRNCGGTRIAYPVVLSGWKMYLSQNVFGQRIKYKYNHVYSGICSGDFRYDAGIAKADLTEIDYGPNKVVINYNQTRNDWALVKDTDGNWANADKNGNPTLASIDSYAFVAATDKAISDISIYANNQISRKYNFSYYTNWTDVNGQMQVACPIAFDNPLYSNVIAKIKGVYTANDGLQSYHLLLKDITEEVTPGNSLPKQTFTYQNLPYDVNMYNGASDGCYLLKNNSITDNKNSIYLKTAANGFGGTSTYTFDAKRISDKIYLPDGTNYLDNDLSGYSCSTYCGTVNVPGKCTGNNVTCDWNRAKNDWETNRNLGLKRARLNKIRVDDGIGNFTESAYIYNNNPVTVLSLVLPGQDENKRDSDFVGYDSAVSFQGKKNLALDTNNSITWAAKSKSDYFQVLTGTGCAAKDPRSGQAYRNLGFDETGIVSESISYTRFKNTTGVADPATWPEINGEACANLPIRQMVFNLRTDSVNSKSGVAGVASLIDQCKTAAPPSYCNYLSTTVQTFDWNFTLSNNPENGNFGAATKNESFLSKFTGTTLTRGIKIAGSQTNYLSQGYGINNTNSYFLNKPTETWTNNPDNTTDTKKYKWQKIYYDNLAWNTLNPTGKNLTTKTETLLDNGTVATRAENIEFDTWGNITKTKDGNGNITGTTYDTTFHAFPLTVTNALNQTTTTTYNYTLGVPISVKDINGQTSKSEYDSLGRLTKVFKPTDGTIASLEMEYHFNETGTYNVPVVVKTLTRTEKDTQDQNKILQTFDLYDGLGNKVQSQSLVNGKVITSYADQHNDSLTLNGIKSYTTESYVSADTFGKFNKTIPAGTKISYTQSSLNGKYSKTTDINNNISYSFTNPENATTKTITPDGVYNFSAVDPVLRTTTGTVCKDTGTTVEADVLSQRDNTNCPTNNKIISKSVADFMGNGLKTIDNNNTELTTSTYDSLGRLIKSSDKDLGNNYIDSFDLNGNVLKSTKKGNGDSLNIYYETSYDTLNRPTQKKVNGSIKTSLYYDQNQDNQDCGTSPKGKVCKQASYDNYGNLIKKYLKYDVLGRLIEDKTNYGGNLAIYFGTADFVTGFTYDNADRILTTRYPEFNDFTTLGITAETVTQTYQGPYLKTVTGDQTYVTDLVFDDLGRLTKRTLGNSLNEEYAYNSERRLDNIKVAGKLDLKYVYNNQTGNITKITDQIDYSQLPTPFNNTGLNKTMEYQYDNLSRLVKAFNGTENHTYVYDDINNLLSKNEGGKSYAYAVDANFPYHGVKKINSGDSVTYDALGRMTSYTVPGQYKMEMKEFDINSGKPQKIIYTDLTNNTSNTETYYYDADGNRIMKALLSGSGQIVSEVLYAGSLLEKDTAQGIYRKNYFADNKLVASRVFVYASPNASPAPTTSPSASPATITDVKTAITNFMVSANDYFPDGKVNIYDVASLIKNLLLPSPVVTVSPTPTPQTNPTPTPIPVPTPSTTLKPTTTPNPINSPTPSPTPVPSPALTVYRCYYSGLPDYFLTSSNTCEGSVYTPDGFTFLAYNAASPGIVPIYRCYSSVSNRHFTTSSSNCEGSATFVSDGAFFYASTTPKTGLVPFYRCYNVASNSHIDTTSSTCEGKSGYINEGIFFYAK